MNTFVRSIKQILKGAAQATATFPASIACALAFAIVTLIRIHLDWQEQEAWNFLFNCLHWAFAVGAIVSLAAITAAQSRSGSRRMFFLANAAGIAAALLALAALYFWGEADTGLVGARYTTLSGIAMARAGMVMLISFLIFVVLAGRPVVDSERSDFARALFMAEKAFFIAAIYGLVILSGASGVAGAFQALLYNDMSEKVYMYIGTIAGFLAYTIYLGYFPDFRRGIFDERLEIVQKQPRFVEILFGFIMVPLMLALTVVLLMWAGRTILTGDWPSFTRLAGIASAYAAGGIWLHIMVTAHDTGLAKFYRRAYPIAAIIILAFEAWALAVRLQATGLKAVEYNFALIWIVAAAAAVLLLILQARAHLAIVAMVCVVAAVSVLPVLGYHALPVTAQTDRLEKLLVAEGMLEDGVLVAAVEEPPLETREAITDAVDYLAYARDARLPEWFDKNLANSVTFEERLGFEQVWPKPDEPGGPGYSDYMFTALDLSADAVDISDYQWAVNLWTNYDKGDTAITIDGVRGTYEIHWIANMPSGIPALTIELDGRVIVDEDMNALIDRIMEKYPPGQEKAYIAGIDEMSLAIATPEIDALVVFRHIEIGVQTREDIINYWMDPEALYIREK